MDGYDGAEDADEDEEKSKPSLVRLLLSALLLILPLRPWTKSANEATDGEGMPSELTVSESLRSNAVVGADSNCVSDEDISLGPLAGAVKVELVRIGVESGGDHEE